jgi:hypothetical protein
MLQIVDHRVTERKKKTYLDIEGVVVCYGDDVVPKTKTGRRRWRRRD